MSALPSTRVPGSPGPRWPLLVGGLLLGGMCGLAGAAIFRGSGELPQAQKGATTWAGGRTQLGSGALVSAFDRKHAAMVAGLKARYDAEARALTFEGRKKLLLGIFNEQRENPYDVTRITRFETNYRINAMILPEDVPRYLELIEKEDPSLTKDERSRLQFLVLRTAVRGNMRELLDKYADSDSDIAKALRQMFEAEEGRRDPFEGIRQAQAKSPEPDPGHNGQDSYQYGMAAERDPERAFAEAQKALSMNSRQNYLSTVLGVVMYRQGFEQAWSMSSRIKETGLRAHVQQRLISSMAQRDPESRDKMLEMLTKDESAGRMQDDSLRNIISQWSQDDPHAALAWIESYSLEADKSEDSNIRNMKRNVIYQLARSAPDEAIPLIKELPEGERGSPISSLISNIARSDVRAALQYVNQFTDKDLDSARSSLIQSWASADPQAAAEYLGGLGEVGNRGNLISNLISGWSEYDSMAASEWLAEQPAGKDRDSGVSQLISSISQDDPESAAIWTFQFSDPNNFKSQLRNQVSNWADKSPTEAANWVRAQTSALDPKSIEELLKIVQDKQKQKLEARK